MAGRGIGISYQHSAVSTQRNHPHLNPPDPVGIFGLPSRERISNRGIAALRALDNPLGPPYVKGERGSGQRAAGRGIGIGYQHSAISTQRNHPHLNPPDVVGIFVLPSRERISNTGIAALRALDNPLGPP